MKKTFQRIGVVVPLLVALMADPLRAETLTTDKAPALAAIPAGLPPAQETHLRQRQTEIATHRTSFTAAMEAYNRTPRTGIVVGSAAEAQLNRQIAAVNSARAAYIAEVILLNREVAQAGERLRVIKAMTAYARQAADWSEEKKARIAVALNQLGFDGDEHVTDKMIRATWSIILARDPADGLTAAASAGDGPGFPGAGTQSHEDCAVFALANASGRPYGLVAASATELIRQAEWRPTTERVAPEQTIKRRGLNGGEVILLAETFGRTSVVASAEFAATLRAGRRILVNVVPANGDLDAGHEILLTKTFQHEGATWYTVMDSNQAPDRFLYLTHQELSIILQENGVTFEPESGQTPALLRENQP